MWSQGSQGSHWGRPDGWRVEGWVVVLDVVERRVGETRWQVDTSVLTAVLVVVQQGRHRLPGPQRDQDGVFIFSQLGNKVAAMTIRPSVRFVGLEGLSRLLLYSEPSTPHVYTIQG